MGFVLREMPMEWCVANLMGDRGFNLFIYVSDASRPRCILGSDVEITVFLNNTTAYVVLNVVKIMKYKCN
jgi:hypothetical protein